MRRHLALILGAVLVLSPLEGVTQEKQIVDVKELAGTWRGWVTRDDALRSPKAWPTPANMLI